MKRKTRHKPNYPTIPESMDFKKHCEDVARLRREIDGMCDEGDRQVRFLNNTYTADDIIKGGNL